MTILKTKIIVLSKLSYQESSLIVSALSPDCGKVDFLVKGAKRISRRAMPVVDIFREFSVEFMEKDGSKLHSFLSIDLLTEFDGIALRPARLPAIMDVVRFLLKNEHAGVVCPILYQALRELLRCTAEGKNYPAFIVKLVYLFENGLLPQIVSDGNEHDSRKFLKMLIDFSCGKRCMPAVGKDYMDRLENWIGYLCRQNELE